VYPCSKVYCLMKLKRGKSESHFEDSKRPVSCDPSAFSFVVKSCMLSWPCYERECFAFEMQIAYGLFYCTVCNV
jgi:hypothetical protein